jgi:hypothetical protein
LTYNDLLEAKLLIARIKVKLLDLAGALEADNVTDKEYAVRELLAIVDYVEEHDVRVGEIGEVNSKS